MSALEDLLRRWEATMQEPAPRYVDVATAAQAVRYAMRQDVEAPAEPPTQKMAPIRDTILRRPPALEVRELRGPELLHALADELEKLEQEGRDL